MKLRGTRVQYGFFIAQKLLFANQYVRKIHRISKFSKYFKIIKFKGQFFFYFKISKIS